MFIKPITLLYSCLFLQKFVRAFSFQDHDNRLLFLQRTRMQTFVKGKKENQLAETNAPTTNNLTVFLTSHGQR